MNQMRSATRLLAQEGKSTLAGVWSNVPIIHSTRPGLEHLQFGAQGFVKKGLPGRHILVEPGSWVRRVFSSLRSLRVRTSTKVTCGEKRLIGKDYVSAFGSATAQRSLIFPIVMSISMCFLGGKAASGQVTAKIILPKSYARAFALRREGNCEGSWAALWQTARRGDRDATFVLWQMILFGGLNPPGWDGQSPVTEAHKRRILSLAIYSTLSRANLGEISNQYRDALPKIISSTITSQMNLGENGRKVAECFDSAPARRNCVSLAQTLGVIPTFTLFVRDFERAANDTGSRASCQSNPR